MITFATVRHRTVPGRRFRDQPGTVGARPIFHGRNKIFTCNHEHQYQPSPSLLQCNRLLKYERLSLTLTVMVVHLHETAKYSIAFVRCMLFTISCWIEIYVRTFTFGLQNWNMYVDSRSTSENTYRFSTGGSSTHKTSTGGRAVIGRFVKRFSNVKREACVSCLLTIYRILWKIFMKLDSMVTEAMFRRYGPVILA